MTWRIRIHSSTGAVNKARFPNVPAVARAYLDIPATVSNERYSLQIGLVVSVKNKSATYGANCFRFSELVTFLLPTTAMKPTITRSIHKADHCLVEIMLLISLIFT